MLLELRDYLKGRGQVSLAELVLHFRQPADALRPMLNRWIAKGEVQCLPAPVCTGCTQCEAEQLELYRWRDSNLIASSEVPHSCTR